MMPDGNNFKKNRENDFGAVRSLSCSKVLFFTCKLGLSVIWTTFLTTKASKLNAL